MHCKLALPVLSKFLLAKTIPVDSLNSNGGYHEDLKTSSSNKKFLSNLEEKDF